MNDIIWLTMRRMRTPLILLILVYSLSVFGMAMIPGQDEFGNPVRLTFLDALYFVAILATTIVDIMNLIGKCVVAGNVRRTAEIVFGDPFSVVVRDDLPPEEEQALLTGPGILYVRDEPPG